MTKDGYISGENLPVTYLTNDDLGTASIDRFGSYGDTSLVALNFAYEATKDLTLEANIGLHNIKDATFANIDKDLKITEYNAGLSYELNKSAEISLRYAMGDFNEKSLKDIHTVVAGIEVKF